MGNESMRMNLGLCAYGQAVGNRWPYGGWEYCDGNILYVVTCARTLSNGARISVYPIGESE